MWFHLLNVNILWFLYYSMTVYRIFLGCKQNNTVFPTHWRCDCGRDQIFGDNKLQYIIKSAYFFEPKNWLNTFYSVHYKSFLSMNFIDTWTEPVHYSGRWGCWTINESWCSLYRYSTNFMIITTTTTFYGLPCRVSESHFLVTSRPQFC